MNIEYLCQHMQKLWYSVLKAAMEFLLGIYNSACIVQTAHASS